MNNKKACANLPLFEMSYIFSHVELMPVTESSYDETIQSELKKNYQA